jgi:hypothetical protein
VASASIGGEVERLVTGFSDVHKYTVSFACVLGVYWGDAREREILCDLIGIPGILLIKGDRYSKFWRGKR